MKTKTPRPSPWDKNYRPYGINEGPRGNTHEWKKAFEFTMGLDEAVGIVKDASPWGILGIPKGSDIYAIKAAFRELVKKVHPDVGGSDEEFHRVYAAYTVLMDIQRYE